MTRYQEKLDAILDDLIPGFSISEHQQTRPTEKLFLGIDCPAEHRGKLIGKGGKIINSIKSVMSAYGAKYGDRVVVEIEES